MRFPLNKSRASNSAFSLASCHPPFLECSPSSFLIPWPLYPIQSLCSLKKPFLTTPVYGNHPIFTTCITTPYVPHLTLQKCLLLPYLSIPVSSLLKTNIIQTDYILYLLTSPSLATALCTDCTQKKLTNTILNTSAHNQVLHSTATTYGHVALYFQRPFWFHQITLSLPSRQDEYSWLCISHWSRIVASIF